MFFFSRKKPEPGKTKARQYASADLDYLHSQKGFACYTGADLLAIPEVAARVTQLREAVGGSQARWDAMIRPSLEVFAAYAQFLPAAGKKADGSPESPGGHHTEPLGLLVHSLQTAIVAMNILRNENVNFGRQPNLRDQHSAAYAVAMALGGLLHDAGKINDWIITAGPEGRVQEYRFVESIPEFVARVNGIPLSSVFINPDDPESASNVPRYMIRGMRPGRGDRHEVVGISKKDLFVSTAAEAFIAESSQELFENFQTFTFESRLPKSMQDPDNRLRRIIAQADRTSASDWKRHHCRGEVTPADLAAIEPPSGDPRPEAPVAEPAPDGPAEEAPEEPLDETQEAQEKPAAMDDAELGEPFDPGSLPDPGPSSEGTREEGHEDADEAEPEAPAAMQAPAPAAAPGLDPDEAAEIRQALSKALRTAFNRCEILANQDKPSALLFPYGYEDAEGNPQFAFFLRADNAARDAIRRLMENASADFNADLNELAGTAPEEVLRTAAAIFPACGFTSPSKALGGLYTVWPMALWKESHRSDGAFKAFMIADWHSVLTEDSRAYKEDFEHWRMRGVWFADPLEIAFSLSPERLKRNISPLNTVLSRPDPEEQGGAAPEPAPAPQPEPAPAPKPAASSAVIEAGEMFFGKDMFAGMEAAKPAAAPSAPQMEQEHGDAGGAPQQDAPEAPDQDEGDELSAFKRPLARNEFKTDREDSDTVSDLQLMQRQFYIQRSECLRLESLPPAEKEDRLAEVKLGLMQKLGGSESVFHKLQRELNLTARGKSTLIGLKDLNGSNIYAAFLWDHRTMESVRKSKGAAMLERLMDHSLVALCRKGRDHEAIHDELEYFSCVMLDPLITQYLVLMGGMETCLDNVVIRSWADPQRPPTGREVLRYFEHYVIQAGPRTSIFGYFAHGSDPLRGIRIDCRALTECARKLNSTCQKTIGRRVLNLDDQETPPFIWREGSEYVICFFSRADPRFPDHDRVAAEERREDELERARDDAPSAP